MTFSHQRERPSGWEDGRTEKWEPAGWQTPLAKLRKLRGFRLLRGFGLHFCNGFRRWLLGESRFLLGGELLLDLEADGIHIHLVRGCGIAENFFCVLPHGRKRPVLAVCTEWCSAVMMCGWWT